MLYKSCGELWVFCPGWKKIVKLSQVNQVGILSLLWTNHETAGVDLFIVGPFVQIQAFIHKEMKCDLVAMKWKIWTIICAIKLSNIRD